MLELVELTKVNKLSEPISRIKDFKVLFYQYNSQNGLGLIFEQSRQYRITRDHLTNKARYFENFCKICNFIPFIDTISLLLRVIPTHPIFTKTWHNFLLRIKKMQSQVTFRIYYTRPYWARNVIFDPLCWSNARTWRNKTVVKSIGQWLSCSAGEKIYSPNWVKLLNFQNFSINSQLSQNTYVTALPKIGQHKERTSS